MRVLVHREHGHPVSGVLGQMEAMVGVADGVGEGAAARNDRHRRVHRCFDDGGQRGREELGVGEQAPADLEDRLD